MKKIGASVPLFLLFVVVLTGCGLPFLSSNDESAAADDAPLALTVSPAANSEAAAPAAPGDDFVAYLNPEMGVALRYPPGWTIREGEPLLLASDSALLGGTEGATTGAILAVTHLNVAADERDLAQNLADFVGTPAESRIIEPAASLQINGQEAADLTMISIDEAGLEFTTFFRLMRHQGATVLVSAVTPDHATFQPILEAVMDSVIISAPLPTVAPPTLTPVPTPSPPPELTPSADGEQIDDGEPNAALSATVPADFVQLVDPLGRYTIGRPLDWLINLSEEDAVLLASSQALLDDNVFSDGGAAVWLFPQTLTIDSEPDPVLILEQFIANFPIYDTFEPVLQPQPLGINGQAGAVSRYAVTIGGANVDAVYYAAVRGHHFVVLVGLTAVDSTAELAPLIDGMAATIVIND